jgi:hypothetical protein
MKSKQMTNTAWVVSALIVMIFLFIGSNILSDVMIKSDHQKAAKLIETMGETQKAIFDRCGGYAVDFGPMLGQITTRYAKHGYEFYIYNTVARPRLPQCREMNGFLSENFCIIATPNNPKDPHLLVNASGMFASPTPLPITLKGLPSLTE